MVKTTLFAITTFAALSTASADSRLHVSTDIVTFDKTVTEAQCIDKAKAALKAIDAKMTISSAAHAVVGSKDGWVLGVDCLQSYKMDGAYVTVVYSGDKAADFDKAKQSLSKGLGGKSEMFK